MKEMGLMLLMMAGLMAIVGLALVFGDRIPFLGKLPGDIRYEGRRVSFFFPVVSCIVVSVVLTIILNLIGRFFRR